MSAILAGTTFIVSDLLDLAIDSDGFGNKSLGDVVSSTVSAIQSGLTLLAGLLLLVGLSGLYFQQSDDGGLLGVVGFLVAFYGTVTAVGTFWVRLSLLRP